MSFCQILVSKLDTRGYTKKTHQYPVIRALKCNYSRRKFESWHLSLNRW